MLNLFGANMIYPEFFDRVEKIRLQDPLSDFLGTFKDGIVEFSYLDIVKASGHSCPTVAGAYLVCLEGLKALYNNEIAKRGDIHVSFPDDSEEGVQGVIANVATHITGATEKYGFKGIAGNFVRRSLMEFNVEINSSVKFRRVDTGKSVEVIYDPSSIPGDPQQMVLMQKILKKIATNDEKIAFGVMWQNRVKNIFDNIDKVIKVI